MPDVSKLMDWYDDNHRDLPWRKTRDPYKIWLSEIILQQTRVDQGMNYYLKFVDHFPQISDLANAKEDTVLKLWQGLGYYSRARNMHHAAKYITEKLDGKFPDNYDEIIKLKGVGPYTAAAISSIVFHEPRPVIDGNVMRVVSRWFAIQDAVDTADGKTEIEKVLKNLIDKKVPGKFNQAIMEFGATWCKPNNPDCANCIFSSKCLAFKQNRVSDLPRKLAKVKIRNRYFFYLVLKLQSGTKHYTFLKKRSGNDIWKGLYEFPLIESPTEETIEKILESPDLNSIINNQKFIIKNISQPFIHKLTHQNITARFLELEINGDDFTSIEGYQKVHASEIEEFPVSRLISKFLETNLFSQY